jgi:penicillin-binding protein 1A
MKQRFSALLPALRRALDAVTGRLRAARSSVGRFGARRIGLAALIAGFGPPALLVLYALVLIPFTPSVDGVLKARNEQPSVLLAADGSVLATFRRTQREWIPLARVPKHVVDALIATEDHRFWDHHGIDWVRSLSAVGHTLLGSRQGGSTLTQQLARNFYPAEIGRAMTATRKLKEMITAIKLERVYTKQEILETYLNTVPFHYNAFGVEMAARTYFNKPASDLTLLQGATLVGMLKGTSAYNPVLNPERARERRNVVLAQMVKYGKLSQKTYAALRGRPLRLDFARQDLDLGPAPHFAEAVRRWLLAWSEPLGYDIYADGLVVQSTIDPKLQQIANAAVARQLDALQVVADVEWGRPNVKPVSASIDSYRQARRRVEPFLHFWNGQPALVDAFVRESPEYLRLVDGGASEADALAQLRADSAFMAALRARKTRLEAGFVAIDPRNGYVRAWVGSRDFATDSFDHVQQARRQPGSTFKPFVYGAALEAGMDPQRAFQDKPVAIRLPNGKVWKPRDFGPSPNGGGPLTLEDGLVYSRNSVTAQVIDEVGARKVVQFAQRLGVRESPLDAVPALALGASEVTLLEMVASYGSIATLGERHAPLMMTRINDRQGAVLADFDPQPAADGASGSATDAQGAPARPIERVLEPDVAVRLIDMLRGAVDRGTGRGIRDVHGVHADVAGKTGTTQNNSDGWFILMHADLVAGAWVGFNDPRVTLRSDYWGQGAHNALHVVGDFTQQALAQGALDANAQFPTGFGAKVEAVLRRVGDTIRRWLGIEAQ